MVQKIEAVNANVKDLQDITEDPGFAVLFIETLWGQYEQSLTRARLMWENQEDAVINAIKEVNKFNKQYRKTLVNLYQETRKTNNEIANNLLKNLNKKNEELNEPDSQSHEGEELTGQLKEVSSQIEKLALTPVKLAFNFIGMLEDAVEKNAESYVAYARERRNAWQQVTNESLTTGKKTSHKLVERSKEGLKELVDVK